MGLTGLMHVLCYICKLLKQICIFINTCVLVGWPRHPFRRRLLHHPIVKSWWIRVHVDWCILKITGIYWYITFLSFNRTECGEKQELLQVIMIVKRTVMELTLTETGTPTGVSYIPPYWSFIDYEDRAVYLSLTFRWRRRCIRQLLLRHFPWSVGILRGYHS